MSDYVSNRVSKKFTVEPSKAVVGELKDKAATYIAKLNRATVNSSRSMWAYVLSYFQKLIVLRVRDITRKSVKGM